MSEELIITYANDIRVTYRDNQEVRVKISEQGPQGPIGPKGDITPELQAARDQAVNAAATAVNNRNQSRDFADQSQQSAVDAAESKTNAASHAAAAAADRSQAQAAASTAQTHREGAETAEGNALDHKDAAGGFASNAAASETNAAQSASIASTASSTAVQAMTDTANIKYDVELLLDEIEDLAEDATMSASIAADHLLAVDAAKTVVLSAAEAALQSEAEAANSAFASEADRQIVVAALNTTEGYKNAAEAAAALATGSASTVTTILGTVEGIRDDIVDLEALALSHEQLADQHRIAAEASAAAAALFDPSSYVLKASDGTDLTNPEQFRQGIGAVSETEVQAIIDGLLDGAPEALDTLSELAQAINNDPDFAASMVALISAKAEAVHTHTIAEVSGLSAALGAKMDSSELTSINAALATKAPLASPSFTGTPLAPNQAAGNDSTRIANTAFVQKAVSDAIAAHLIAGHEISISDVSGLSVALAAKWEKTELPATAFGKSILNAASDDAARQILGVSVPVAAVSQAEAEAGTATTVRGWTAQRVRQAVNAVVGALTKASVGLGNVDNTSDANKPISTAVQTALNGKANSSHTHAIDNVTGLQAALDGKQASGSYEPARAAVTQVLAEAGSDTTIRGWTAQRVRQAIAAFAAPISHHHDDQYVPFGGRIASAIDVKTLVSAGMYRLDAAPTGVPADCNHGNLLVIRNDDQDTLIQLVSGYAAGHLYWRSGNLAAFAAATPPAWRMVWDDTNLDIEGIGLGDMSPRVNDLNTLRGTRFFGCTGNSEGAPNPGSSYDAIGWQIEASGQRTQFVSSTQSGLYTRIDDSANADGSWSDWVQIHHSGNATTTTVSTANPSGGKDGDMWIKV